MFICSDLFLGKTCSYVLTSFLARHVHMIWLVPWQDMFMCSDLFLDKTCSCVLTSSLPRHVNVFWQVPWQDMFMWFIFQLRLKSKFDIYCILSRENHRWQHLRIFFKGINLCWLSKLILEEQNTHLGKTFSHHIATYFFGVHIAAVLSKMLKIKSLEILS
jgi:hypothetical protein